MKISMPMVLGAAALAWLVFGKKSAGSTVAPATSPATKPSSLEKCLENASLTDCAKFGFDTGSKIADAVANEMKGMDGVAHASLEGHMTSLGAYNGLGGSFYGSV